MKTECGDTVKVMIEKLDEDKKELVEKICEMSGLKNDSEVFKFLGLSQ